MDIIPHNMLRYHCNIIGFIAIQSIWIRSSKPIHIENIFRLPKPLKLAFLIIIFHKFNRLCCHRKSLNKPKKYLKRIIMLCSKGLACPVWVSRGSSWGLIMCWNRTRVSPYRTTSLRAFSLISTSPWIIRSSTTRLV